MASVAEGVQLGAQLGEARLVVGHVGGKVFIKIDASSVPGHESLSWLGESGEARRMAGLVVAAADIVEAMAKEKRGNA